MCGVARQATRRCAVSRDGPSDVAGRCVKVGRMAMCCIESVRSLRRNGSELVINVGSVDLKPIARSPGIVPVWWLPMNVYLSHSTALLFWRAWSVAAAIPLRTFHDLSAADASLFPASLFPAPESLRGEDVRVAEVRAVLEATLRDFSAVDGLLPSEAAVASALREVCRAWTDGPLHIMVGKAHGTRNSDAVTRHRLGTALPRQAFIKVAPEVFVCSPEFVFIQLASALSRGALVAVGYELCGCYPLGEERAGAFVRRPLSSPRRMAAFAARASGLTGVKAARAAAKQVLAKSGSLMETEVSIAAFSSVAQGGLGLRPPRMKEPVALSAQARAATGLSRVVCDWLWRSEHVAIEYDGQDAHRSPRQQAHDARKHDALRIDGFNLIVLTSSQFHHVSQCTELLRGAARSAGQRKRRFAPSHLPRHMTLREQVRTHHRQHFPSRFRRASS